MTSESVSTDPVSAESVEATRTSRASVIGRGRHVFLLGTVITLLAWWVPNYFGARWLSTWTSTLVFAMAAAGIGLLYSRLGLASLTQVALIGVGGWVALRLEFAFHLPFPIVVLASGTITALIGLAISLPTLRLSGLYLALVTLMMAAGFHEIFIAAGFPNGGSGFLGYQSSGDLERMSRPSIATTDPAYFRLVLIVAVACFLLVWLHDSTKPGRAWRLIAQSEGAAHATGINVTFYKTWAFTLAAFLAGIGGAMFAGQLGQLGPSSFQTIDSLLLFGLVLVGGAYHWSGWIIGVIIFKAFPALLDDLGLNGNIATMIAGLALILNLIAAPRGIVGEVGRLIAANRKSSESDQ